MRFTWTNVTERRILVSNFSVTRNSLRESHTLDWFLHICVLPQDRLRRLHVLKDTTQLPCIRKSTFRWILSQFLITSFHRFPRSIVTSIWDGFSFLPISLFQHSHSTFVIIRFRPFSRLFINLTMCVRALFPKPTTALGLVEHFQNELVQVPLKQSLQSHRDILPLGLFPLELRVLDFSHSAAWKNLERKFGCVNFARFFVSWRKLQLSPLIHCPLVSHCQQSPRFLCTRCLSLDSWPRRCFHNFRFLRQNSGFANLARYFFSPSFSICENQVLFSSDESPSHTIPVRSWVSQTLVFLLFYNPSKISSCGIFVMDNKIPSHFESNSWTSSFRRPTVNRSAKFSTESLAPVTHKNS